MFAIIMITFSSSLSSSELNVPIRVSDAGACTYLPQLPIFLTEAVVTITKYVTPTDKSLTIFALSLKSTTNHKATRNNYKNTERKVETSHENQIKYKHSPVILYIM